MACGRLNHRRRRRRRGDAIERVCELYLPCILFKLVKKHAQTPMSGHTRERRWRSFYELSPRCRPIRYHVLLGPLFVCDVAVPRFSWVSLPWRLLLPVTHYSYM